MNETPKKSAPVKARLPRGLGDRGPADIAATNRMIEKIRESYELYGFEAVETPFIEYTEALGKFLPDQDRPNEGVFSFQDDDEQWLSLRYDLTAPLARYVAENFDRLPKPYRSYRSGFVFRNEKPGPGRFRQFMQFDADTVGAPGVAADAEMCMMAADTLERLGIERGKYVIKVNNRKVLDGVMEAIGLGGDENAGRRLTVLRAIDKLDRLGWGGVEALLRGGRKDDSGDFTPGAGLVDTQVSKFLQLTEVGEEADIVAANSQLIFQSLGINPAENLTKEMIIQTSEALSKLTPAELPPDVRDKLRKPKRLEGDPNSEQLSTEMVGILIQKMRTMCNVANVNEFGLVEYDYRNKGRVRRVPLRDWAFFNYFEKALTPEQTTLWAGLDELYDLCCFVRAVGFQPDRICIDPSVVRGLEYYTGPVFEAELLIDVRNDQGHPVRFGSVGGGGRYDGLVARFRGEPVPATGFSIGVSRLLSALKAVGSPIAEAQDRRGPVVVLVMDKGEIAHYQGLVARLRAADIRSELYLGAAGMNAQLKYADRRGAVCAVIQGSNERNAADGAQVMIRDLVLGAELAAASKDRSDYLELRKRAQFPVAESLLVEAVNEVLGRYGR